MANLTCHSILQKVISSGTVCTRFVHLQMPPKKLGYEHQIIVFILNLSTKLPLPPMEQLKSAVLQPLQQYYTDHKISKIRPPLLSSSNSSAIHNHPCRLFSTDSKKQEHPLLEKSSCTSCTLLSSIKTIYFSVQLRNISRRWVAGKQTGMNLTAA